MSHFDLAAVVICWVLAIPCLIKTGRRIRQLEHERSEWERVLVRLEERKAELEEEEKADGEDESPPLS